MQNDIVKPPSQPNQSPKQEPASVGNEVHAQPGLAEHPALEKPKDVAPIPQQSSGGPLSTETEAPEVAATTKKHHSNKPVGAIVAAVVVFLSLASGAVYMTMQNKEDSKPAASNANTQAPAATSADTSSDIDDTLNEAAQLPTSNEDPANDLSDPSLGL